MQRVRQTMPRAPKPPNPGRGFGGYFGGQFILLIKCGLDVNHLTQVKIRDNYERLACACKAYYKIVG